MKQVQRFFCLLFDSDVFTLLVEQTNSYGQQKNRSDFRASDAYIRRFIGILLFTGYHSLPQEEMYWSLDKDVSVPIVRESMSRSQYRNMKQNLHLGDNSQTDNMDKMYKVRPSKSHCMENMGILYQLYLYIYKIRLNLDNKLFTRKNIVRFLKFNIKI